MNITIKNLSKAFFNGPVKVDIFKNLSFTFKQNYSYALIGPSGIGKSTLIHMLAGIDQPSSGSIFLNNQTISKTSFSSRINLRSSLISIVFQKSLLLHELSVLENIMLKKIIHGSTTNIDVAHAKQLLDSINLLDKAEATPTMLSGGQQQKIAILRAVFQAPKFLLADEPTGSLDELSGKQIIHLLLHYKKKCNMGLIISTHDINIAKQCDYIIKIENKQLKYT